MAVIIEMSAPARVGCAAEQGLHRLSAQSVPLAIAPAAACAVWDITQTNRKKKGDVMRAFLPARASTEDVAA
jgi:hypothetical protein